MAEEEKRTITIKKINYNQLAQLKIDEDLKTFDEVIEFLLKK